MKEKYFYGCYSNDMISIKEDDDENGEKCRASNKNYKDLSRRCLNNYL